MYTLKHDVRQHMLSAVAESLGIPSNVRIQMAKWFEDYSAYRTCLKTLSTNENGQCVIQMSPSASVEQAQWSHSSVAFFGLVEDLAFREDYDTVLRVAARSCKAPADVLTYESVKAKLDMIKSQIKQEMAERERVATTTTADSSTSTTEAAATEQAASDTTPNLNNVDDNEPTHMKDARRLCQSRLFTIVEPESQVEFQQAFNGSAVARLRGTDDAEYYGVTEAALIQVHVVIYYQVT